MPIESIIDAVFFDEARVDYRVEAIAVHARAVREAIHDVLQYVLPESIRTKTIEHLKSTALLRRIVEAWAGINLKLRFAFPSPLILVWLGPGSLITEMTSKLVKTRRKDGMPGETRIKIGVSRITLCVTPVILPDKNIDRSPQAIPTAAWVRRAGQDVLDRCSVVLRAEVVLQDT